jgi:type II secretory ATPase GspE/PulE/Tfp pilus assembly ATPase PilB-like protein
MENSQKKTITNITSKMKEAETYYSMGLPRESLGIYEELLPVIPEGDLKNREEVRLRIEFIRNEIKERSKSESKDLSQKNIADIQKALTLTEDNLPAIYLSAFAFKELGLNKEAISEYEKLLTLNYEKDKVIAEVSECLFKLYPKMDLIIELDRFFNKFKFNDEQLSRIKFGLGLEMERRDNKEQALYFYETAAQLDPKSVEIKDRLNSVAAQFATGSKYDYLLNNKIVTTEQLLQALAQSKKTKQTVEHVLVTQFRISKQDIGQSLTDCYRHPFKAYDPDLSPPIELLGNLKKSFLLQDRWVPLGWDKDCIEVLIDDPINLNKIDIVKALLKSSKTKFYVGIREDIEAYIKLFFDRKDSGESSGSSEINMADFDVIPDVSFEEENEPVEDTSAKDYDEASGKVVKLVDQILVAAYRKNASDIHVEPSSVTKSTVIRFRMDGVCQEYIQVPNAMSRGILSRIKIMAGLDIAERRLPQDGKIKFKRKGVPPFELRVATLPTAGDFEDAVMRILAKAGALKLDDMGLSQRNLDCMKKIIAQPYGLVLVVGPTGSGKTTSLHSALGYINKPGIKIWTAEDPVEISQHGLRQVEAKPKIGLDFARIMRAFLRADPDVIMIGEMRDNETASIAIEASLTGHLVFSTLHTNSAPETVTRLLDMGLNALNFSDAFLGVMAQRLVRRLCPKCRQEYHPSEDEFQELVEDYGKEYFDATGIKFTQDFKLFKPAGCEACSNTGYKGRLGIHELMEGSLTIKRMIKKSSPSEVLLMQALKEGMTTLKQDGILKVVQGMTDISEVRRVCVT